MKLRMQFAKYCLTAVLLLGAGARMSAAVTVGVDSGATWLGFMNVTDLPADGGAYQFGSGWGTADLKASFSGPLLTLTPNTNIDRDAPADPFWWKGNGSANKNMFASMYVQDNALAGQTVTFTGLVRANSLVSPYVSTIFIKDFDSSFALVGSATVPVAPGVFSLTLATTAGHNIQYGFETVGPNARLATVASLGFAQIAPVPEPSTVALVVVGAICLAAARRRSAMVK